MSNKYNSHIMQVYGFWKKKVKLSVDSKLTKADGVIISSLSCYDNITSLTHKQTVQNDFRHILHLHSKSDYDWHAMLTQRFSLSFLTHQDGSN